MTATAAVASLAMTLLCQVAAPQIAGALPVGNPVRVSEMGPEGTPGYGPPAGWFTHTVAIAHSPDANRYLVVWTSDEKTPIFAKTGLEIWGQFLDGAGSPIGGDFRISQVGPDGSNDYGALFPAVTYNSAAREFLVVWAGNDNLPGMSQGEVEVFGQRISLSGAEVGPDDFRISQMPAQDDPFSATYPSVAYNTKLNEYLVVWQGDTYSGKAVDEYEIFYQRVSATGSEIGMDTRISNVGPDGDPKYDTGVPDLVYNASAGEYLVVFTADDNANGMKDDEYEILGQRLSANPGSVGTQIGADDYRISHVGPDAGPAQQSYEALRPAVALDPSAGRYLVVWDGDHNLLGGISGNSDIWGQALYASGASAGKPAGSMIPVSQFGADAPADHELTAADVAYNVGAKQFLVTFQGDEETAPWVNDEFEIYGQAVSVTGGKALAVGPDDFHISSMKPNGDANFDAYKPAVASGSSTTTPGYLVAWAGDTKSGTLVDDDFEVWAQRVAP
ncbi:MAG: hypothetical protein EDR02_13700 [Actinobacteria bacterium]|nr:MAG: hypothetical protein EDR02_13700 [Actinomycetota bacterium]RIK04879.1 MAG: hypothetical protein DCC48_12640 [Acidobacteriota bacterium]